MAREGADGKDTDRLPEEQERGISIDLGYAPLDSRTGGGCPSSTCRGTSASSATWSRARPGSTSSCSSIDAVEGARPQTLEHLAILRLLGIDHGVVAVTKTDAVDAETLELAAEEARELVPGAAVVAVERQDRRGLDELGPRSTRGRDAVEQRRRELPDPALRRPRRSRCAGSARSSTGTLWSGSIGEGDELEREPAGLDVRVRSVQVHDRPVERAEAGSASRVALPGIERGALRRGDALVERGAYPVELPARRRARGARADPRPAPASRSTTGRPSSPPASSGSATASRSFASPRRSWPPAATMSSSATGPRSAAAGARPGAAAAPSAARLELLERDDPASIVQAGSVHEPSRRDLAAGAAVPRGARRRAAARPERGRLALLDAVARRAPPRAPPGSARAELPARSRPAAGDLLPQRPWARAPAAARRRAARRARPTPRRGGALGDRGGRRARWSAELEAAGFEPIKVEDRELAALPRGRGPLVRVGDGSPSAAAPSTEAARSVEECERAGSITLARFRDLLAAGAPPSSCSSASTPTA